MLHRCSAFPLLSYLILLGLLGIFFFRIVLVLGFRHLTDLLEFKLNWVYKVPPIL